MFNNVRLSLAVPALLALGAVSMLTAGSFNNNRTIMKFNSPVEISGEALAAGTYVFQTLPQDRNMVVVKNQDESHVLGVFNTIEVTAPSTPTKTTVTFTEGPANAPQALHTWFNAGESLGWEFNSR
jgi:hypothetical protein